MKMRLVLNRLVLMGLNALGGVLGFRPSRPTRTEVCLRTTDGGEICTWVYSG
jgi:hypothetical protein